MMIGSVIVGKAPFRAMVWTPLSAMLKLITSRPGSPAGASPQTAFVFAAQIASRKVTTPSTLTVSPTPVTVIVLAEVAVEVRNNKPTSITTVAIVVLNRPQSVSYLSWVCISVSLFFEVLFPAVGKYSRQLLRSPPVQVVGLSPGEAAVATNAPLAPAFIEVDKSS